jgi:hypothetical protein
VKQYAAATKPVREAAKVRMAPHLFIHFCMLIPYSSFGYRSTSRPPKYVSRSTTIIRQLTRFRRNAKN